MPTEPMAMIGSVRRATGSAHLLALLDKARAGIVTVDRGQAIHVANRRLGELLRNPAAAVADAVWLADLLDGSTVLTEALAHEVDAALRGSIADSRPRTIAIVIGHGNEARFLALHVTRSRTRPGPSRSKRHHGAPCGRGDGGRFRPPRPL